MKVLFISHSAGVAGAERSLAALVDAAVEMGLQVEVVLPASGPIEALLASNPAIDVVKVPSHNWIGNRSRGLIGLARLAQCVADLRRQRKALTGSNADVVVVNSVVAPGFMFLGHRSRKPVVVFVRESLFSNPKLHSFLSPRFIRMLVSRWTGGGGIIVNSDYVARDWPDASVVWPSVEPRYLTGEIPQPSRSVGQTEALRVGMVGTVDPAKGQADFVEALTILKDRGVSVEAWIAGGGTRTDVSDLELVIDRAGALSVRTSFDWVDASDVYDWSDVVVVCSKAEAFGKVTVESLLRRTPVVGYDAGGTRELSQLGGIILTECSPKAIADALEPLANSHDALAVLQQSIDVESVRGRMRGNARQAIETLISLAYPGE